MPAKHFAEVCALSPKNFSSRSGRGSRKTGDSGDTHPPRVRIPWRTASESTNGGVEGMQIGGSITTIERLRSRRRIKEPCLLWTKFSPGGFNYAGQQYSENETKKAWPQGTTLIS